MEICKNKNHVSSDKKRQGEHLLQAVRDGDSAALKKLITAQAPLDVMDKWGDTAAIWAARQGHHKTAAMIETALRERREKALEVFSNGLSYEQPITHALPRKLRLS